MIFIYTIVFGFLQLLKGETLVAKFSKEQIKGTIKFHKINNDTNVSTDFDESFNNSRSIFSIRVFKQPPNTQHKSCQILVDPILILNISRTENQTISGNYAQGKDSLLAHTIVLYDKDDNKLGCSTITTYSKNSQYVSAFISNPKIAGKVEFLKNEYNDTAIFGGFHVVNTNISSLRFHIAAGKVSSRDGTCDSSLEKVFDPSNVTNGMKCQENGNCPMGDLSGKISNMSIVNGNLKQFFFSYPNFAFSQTVGKALVVMSNNQIVGCGNIELTGPVEAQSTFTTTLHKRISGFVKLYQVSPYHPTKLEVSLSGLDKRVKGYHVHQYPIANIESPCSPQSVGGHLNPFGVDIRKSPDAFKGTDDLFEMGDLSGKYGYLSDKNAYNLTATDMNLPMFGPYSSLGRSVVLHANDASGSRLVCANIEPKYATRLSGAANFTANSYSVIDGYVRMSQWMLQSGVRTPTVMQVQLSHERGMKTFGHKWHVHQLRVNHKTETATCKSVAGHYNPYNVLVKHEKYKEHCSPDSPYSCEIGDSSSKTKPYDITGDKKFYVDDLSPMLGHLTVLGRSVTFHGKNGSAERIACADIIPEQESDAIFFKIYLQRAKHTNNISFLSNKLADYLGFNGDTWQINTVETAESTRNDACVRVSFYVLGNKSSNQYYISQMKQLSEGTKTLGDGLEICESHQPSDGQKLVAKFSKEQIKGTVEFHKSNNVTNVLTNFETKNKTVFSIRVFKQPPYTQHKPCQILVDPVLVLNISSSGDQMINRSYVQGKDSLLAHTIVLYDKDENKLGCSTITTYSKNSQYASAFISNPKIAGKVEFLKNEYNDTAIFGGFHVVNTNVSSLRFHIAAGKVSSKDGTCDSSLEKVFDPSNVTNGMKCQENGNCPMGDLSGKISNMSIVNGNLKQFFFSYPNFAFSQTVGKALVVISNNKIIGCGNIELTGPIEAQSTFTTTMHKGISGFVKLYQVSPYHPTKLEVSLSGLNNGVKGYHVHQYPIANLERPCSLQSVGGHLNPFGVDIKKSPDAYKGAADLFEMGDLSGKYGYLSSKNIYKLMVQDMNLPMYGPYSSLGRSIVLHADDMTGSRLVCANIEPKNATKLSGVAKFTSNSYFKINGYVRMSQWILQNGVRTPTVMQVQLSHEGGMKTLGHKWHVHQLRVNHKTETGLCKSVAGHYNPYRVLVKHIKYKEHCSPESPYSCEIGDSSSKTGLYDITGNKKFYVDDLSPMFGHLTALGRSVTFHGKNGGAERIACADIIPEQESDAIFFKIYFQRSKHTNNIPFLSNKLADYLGFNGDTWQINTVETAENNRNDACVRVSFYVLGNKSSNQYYISQMRQLSEGTKTLGDGLEICESLQLSDGLKLVAKFSKEQIQGTIEFHKSNNVTNVLTNFETKNKTVFSIRVFKQPPYTQHKPCQILVDPVFVLNISSSGDQMINRSYVQGKDSLLAHTIVLYDKDENKLGCSTITTYSKNSQYASAFISNPKIAGKVEFLKNEYNDTAIFGGFHVVNTNVSSLRFHIAAGKVSSRDGTCDSSLEKVFDPSNVTNGMKCQENGNCPMGDLSGKISNMSIVNGNLKQFFFSYPNFAFSQTVGKALVVMSNNQIIGCGYIELTGPIEAQSTFTTTLHKRISGFVKLYQVSPYHPTKLEVSLSGLDKRVKGYHVHQYPIANIENPCSPQSVGGHLNPFGVDIKNSPAAYKGAADLFEMGDLSGKYGYLSSKNIYKLMVQDMNLPMYGPYSSLGRSIVLHADDMTGSRLVCANIEPKNATKLSGVAKFTSNSYFKINGYVRMSQWILQNGVRTPTVMQVQLSHEGGMKTLDHKWHVHQLRVNHKTETGLCKSVAGHYNPYRVLVKHIKYKEHCSPESPYSCEIGDSSSKTGLYDITGNKKFYVDDLSPMFGHLTALGRSVTFHAKNGSGERIACADIIPEQDSDTIFIEIHLQGKKYMNNIPYLTNKLAVYLGFSGDAWRINTVETATSTRNDACMRVSFFVLGRKNLNQYYLSKIRELSEGSQTLGDGLKTCAQVDPNSSCAFQSSFYVVLTSLLVYLLH